MTTDEGPHINEKFLSTVLAPITPIPPQCQCQKHSVLKVPPRAEVWLIEPDGRPNLVGWYTVACGEQIAQELLDVCGEQWTLAPLRRA